MQINKIAPIWDKAIKIYKKDGLREYVRYYKKNKLDILDARYCIVGEAYGFKAQYVRIDGGKRCDDCNSMATTFMDAFDHVKNSSIDNPVFIPTKRVDSDIKLFEEHWCKIHV